METTPAAAVAAPAAKPLSAWSILLRVFLLFAITGTVALGLLAWSLWPRGEVRELRRIALSELPGKWERRVELRAGGWLVGVGQLAAAFAPMPPEAHAALDCVDNVEVSVNERVDGADESAPGALLERSREAMLARGWEPLVTVRDHGDTVLVFTQAQAGANSLRFCALVHDGRDLVIVTCEGRPGPLLDTLAPRMREHLVALR